MAAQLCSESRAVLRTEQGNAGVHPEAVLCPRPPRLQAVGYPAGSRQPPAAAARLQAVAAAYRRGAQLRQLSPAYRTAAVTGHARPLAEPVQL